MTNPPINPTILSLPSCLPRVSRVQMIFAIILQPLFVFAFIYYARAFLKPLVDLLRFREQAREHENAPQTMSDSEQTQEHEEAPQTTRTRHSPSQVRMDFETEGKGRRDIPTRYLSPPSRTSIPTDRHVLH